MSCGCETLNGVMMGGGAPCLQPTRMHRFNSLAQSIPTGVTYTPLAFDSIGFESANNWDGTFTIWTPPAGTYYVCVGCEMPGTSLQLETAVDQAAVRQYEGSKWLSIAGGSNRRSICTGILDTLGGVAIRFLVRHSAAVSVSTIAGLSSTYCCAAPLGFVCGVPTAS